MASIKVKFRPSAINGKEGSIYFQVTHNHTMRHINTGYHVFANEWNGKISAISIPLWINSERKNYLKSIANYIECEVKRLQTIITLLDKGDKSYTVEDILAKFNRQTNQTNSLFNFMQNIICQLKRLNRIRTSETYTATLNSFIKFRSRQDILLCDIDSDTVMLYEAWLKSRGVCPNSISFYMRILRATYNRAVEKGLIEQQYPFKHVYTGIDKTVKRAVPLKAIKRIKELDLASKPHLDFARDMFLFSFYTRGMSFIDMAYLKKSDLKNGILTYRRKKTGQQLSIKWETCMTEVVAKYTNYYDTQYLLPIISNPLADERKQYRNAIYRVNVALKEIARLTGLPVPLTMYCARHGWASIAKSKNIPISVISEGMGHDSEETTRIYLASLDSSVVDKANSLILKDL